MFHTKTILIVDGNAYAALDLAAAIEAQRGRVAGPVASRIDALATLANGPVHAAVIDADLPEARQLVHALADAHLPYVLHAAGPIPPALAATAQGGAALFRPVDPAIVMTMIAIAIGKGEQDSPATEGALTIKLSI